MKTVAESVKRFVLAEGEPMPLEYSVFLAVLIAGGIGIFAASCLEPHHAKFVTVGGNGGLT